MKMALKASSSRKWVALLTAGCLAGIGLQGCTTDSHDGAINPILTASSPSPIPVAPTLAPVQPGTTTPITSPNFGQVTPPPVSPDLPEQPQIEEFNADQEFASLSYKVDITGLKVRGVIESVTIQALNITCGTDVTSAIRPSAISQFQNLLIGRGNTFIDAAGFDFSFTFPTDPRFFSDLRILFKAIRGIPKVDADGEITIEDELTGDDVVIVLTITDSFGQVIRVDNSIFSEDEERTEIRGSVIPACGNLNNSETEESE